MGQTSFIGRDGGGIEANYMIGSQMVTQGNVYYVKPRTGSDGNNGTSPRSAFKTLVKALASCSAGQNDTVYLLAEGSSASLTTDLLTTTLDWNLNNTHLIGVSAGNLVGQRARISWASTAASASDIPLLTVSGSGCLIAGISLVLESADANLAFGLNVTGDRCRFSRVNVSWPANAAADCAGAYAVKLDGATDDVFEECVFGSYTIDQGTAANQILLIDTGCSATMFRDCYFISRIEHITNSPAVRLADAGSVGFGCVWFDRCKFISTSVNAAYAQSGAFKTTAAQTDGRIVLTDCWTNAGKWDVDDADMILNGCVGVPIDDNAGEILAV